MHTRNRECFREFYQHYVCKQRIILVFYVRCSRAGAHVRQYILCIVVSPRTHTDTHRHTDWFADSARSESDGNMRSDRQIHTQIHAKNDRQKRQTDAHRRSPCVYIVRELSASHWVIVLWQIYFFTLPNRQKLNKPNHIEQQCSLPIYRLELCIL